MPKTAPSQPFDADLSSTCRLQGLLSVAAAGCLLSSFRLWTPQRIFPQIPFLSDFAWPDPLAWGILTLLLISLVWLLISSFRSRGGRLPAAMYIVCGIGLLLEDQHRAQPWMLHFLWLSLILLIGSPRRTTTLVVMLTSSLYVYSAASKCNLMFLEQHGQVILAGLLKSLALDLGPVPDFLRRVLIAGFPLGEFAIGVGLLFPGLRRRASVAAVLMHGLLILTFSPLGLNHEWGVLIWNGFFLLQAICLWILAARVNPGEKLESGRDWIGISVGLGLWLFPLLRLTGHIDQWTGWSLYSPRADVVRIYLAEPPAQIDEGFPDFTSAKYQLIQEDAGSIEFVPDRWSIASLHVPLNPEARLEFAVARSLCARFDTWDRVAVMHETRDLMDAKQRVATLYQGREQFAAFAEQFDLPTRSNGRYR